MKKILFLVLLVSSVVNAQDSLRYQNKSQMLYFDKIIEANAKTPVNYYVVPLQNYTSSKIAFSHTKNNIKQKQQAQKITDISLGATGFYRLNRTIFTGKIGYTKNLQEGIGWNGSRMYPQSAVEQSPFYYLSYQEGDWDNQFYTLSGTMSVPIINEKLYGTIGVDYNTRQYFRKDNPKSKLIYLNLLAKAGLHYQFLPSQLLGVTVYWGYLNNEIDITYSNHDLNVPTYPNLYNRMSLGYGLISSAKYRYGKEVIDKTGLDLHYFGENKRYSLQTTVGFLYSKNTFNEDKNELEEIGTYKVSRINGELYGFDKTKYRYASLKMTYEQGANFRNKAGGKNYEATLLKGSAEYGFTNLKYGKKQYGLSVVANYNYLTKEDYSMQNKVRYATLGLGLNFYKDFRVNAKHKIWWRANTAYQFKLNRNSSFGNTANKFVKEIAAPEILYATAPQVRSYHKVALHTQFKTFTSNIGFFANTQIFVNLSDEATKIFRASTGYNRALGIFINVNY